MRKIWPSEDNCSKHVRISHNSPSMCEFRTTAQACAKFAQHLPLVRNLHNTFSLCEIHTSPCVFGAKSPLFCRLHVRSFLLYFFDVNSFLIPVISQSQALLCKDYKRGGNHLSNTCYVLHLVKYRVSLLSLSLYYFLFLGSQTTSEDVFLEDERLNF